MARICNAIIKTNQALDAVIFRLSLTVRGLPSGASPFSGLLRNVLPKKKSTEGGARRIKAKFNYAILLANQLASWFASWCATC